MCTIRQTLSNSSECARQSWYIDSDRILQPRAAPSNTLSHSFVFVTHKTPSKAAVYNRSLSSEHGIQLSQIAPWRPSSQPLEILPLWRILISQNQPQAKFGMWSKLDYWILTKRLSLSVKVHSISLNPIDPLYTVHPAAPPGRVVGSDISGTVETIGEGVTSWNVGDRVAGFLQGGE